MEIEIDEDKLRHVAGAFATGIAVVSIMDNSGNVSGITVNSYLSVSLDPPLILFSLGNDSKILPSLKKDLPISLNILSEEQKSLSDFYAGYPSAIENVPLFTEGRFVIIPNASAWYQLSVHEIHPAGDHHLILCKVLDCGRDEHKKPILFYNGYRDIGNNTF